MEKEEFIWLSKYIKDAVILKNICKKSDDFIEILINYINLCSGNINIDIVEKMLEADSDKKSEMIARTASNTSFMLSKARTYEQKMELLDKIKEASTDLNAEHISKMAYSLSINKRRTFFEQMLFIEKINSIEDEDLSKIIYKIVTNNQLLKKMDFETQKEAIDLIQEANTDFKKIYMQSVLVNDFLLKNYSSKQHLEFLKRILETNSDVKTLLVSNYINLGISKRSFSEQLEVIKKINDAKSDNIASYIEYIACNPNLINFLSSKNHNILLEKINNTSDELKARCISIYILNQNKVNDGYVEYILRIIEKINMLDNNLKISCIETFITKSNYFFKCNYNKQEKFIDLIEKTEDERLNKYIELLNSFDVSSKKKIKTIFNKEI